MAIIKQLPVDLSQDYLNSQKQALLGTIYKLGEHKVTEVLEKFLANDVVLRPVSPGLPLYSLILEPCVVVVQENPTLRVLGAGSFYVSNADGSPIITFKQP